MPDRRLLPTILALLALRAAPARAAPESPDAADPKVAAQAAELFRAGRAAASAGDDKTACARFAESEQLQPAPGTQLNLGACEAKQGHLLAAREHFRKAGNGFKPEDRRRALALNTANDLTDRLAVLTARLADGTPPDAEVTVAGTAVDAKALAQGMELDPGPAKLVVSASGRQPRTYDLELKEGEKRELSLEAGPAIVVETPEVAPPPVDSRASLRKLEHTLGYVGVGVGAAGIALGSIFGILTFNEASVVKSNCNASLACNATGVSAASSGSTDGVVSTTMFVAGAAFAAAGVYLWISTAHADPAGLKPLGSGSFVLSPVALRAGGGAAGTWAF